jgi:hypothetical protein
MKYKIQSESLQLPRFVRRNRRIIAAGLIGLAAIVFSSTLSSNPSSELNPNQGILVPAGKVAIAIESTSQLITAALTVGDKTDLIAVDEGYATTVARNAQILAIGAASNQIGGGTTELLVAVAISESARVAAANQSGNIQLLLPASE